MKKTICTALIGTCAVAGSALATTTASFDAKYAAGSRTVNAPSASTGFNLRWVTQAGDQKPDPGRKVVLHFAKGTNVDTRARTRCTATDADFQSKGEAACPPKSRVGAGTAQLVTGIGTKAQGGPDPVSATLTAFNAGGGLLVYVNPELGQPGVMHGQITFDGRTGKRVAPVLTLRLPALATPGFGDESFSSFALSVAPSSARIAGKHRTYMRTPATCPASRHWALLATYYFENGQTSGSHVFSPCRRKK